jgi:hypothetical protein
MGGGERSVFDLALVLHQQGCEFLVAVQQNNPGFSEQECKFPSKT